MAMRRRWVWANILMVGLALGAPFVVSAMSQDKPAAPAAPAAAPAAGTAAQAQPTAAPAKVDYQAKIKEALGSVKCQMDTTWTLITGMLVFFMNLGFATVETGMCRAKNAVNILSKNFVVFAASAIAFWFIGWGFMFGDGNPFIGLKGLLMVSGDDFSPLTGKDYVDAGGVYNGLSWSGIPLWTKVFFQMVFAGTAATIVSGAVAERIKYLSFIIFTFFMGMFIYPIVGHWIWGGGWAQTKGFADFAGSTQVHSIGGWAALVGVAMLGPRIGKYAADGKVNPLPGHNMALGLIGTFVLWFGWFGFNPGSTMGLDAEAIGEIAMTTNMAACAATLTATAASWIMMGKPDLGMTLNGCLAGLVAITAPCAFVSVGASVIIGAIAGVLVVFAIGFWDKLKLDDPVGALSVHLVNGVFGTICVGLFSIKDKIQGRTANPATDAGLFYGGGFGQLTTQLLGVGATAAFVVVSSVIFWSICKATVGMRVSKEEEMQGLDIGEHGQECYPSFVMHQGK